MSRRADDRLERRPNYGLAVALLFLLAFWAAVVWLA
jgi:hypothetical protein